MIRQAAVGDAGQRIFLVFAERPQLVGGNGRAFHLRGVAVQRHHELDEVDLIGDDGIARVDRVNDVP